MRKRWMTPLHIEDKLKKGGNRNIQILGEDEEKSNSNQSIKERWQ